MTTSFAQASIYFPPSSNDDLIPTIGNFNVSNLGTSQCVALSTPVALPIGRRVGVTFQVARPPPLLYFSNAAATDEMTLQTPDGLIIALNSANPGIGFNGKYFQPSAGGTYIIYFGTGAAKAAGDICLYVQSVLENTVGQYIDMGSVAFTTNIGKLEHPPQISQIVAANTTSAVPNTFCVDFFNYPISEGMNILAAYRVMVTSSGMETFGKDYLQTVGANAKVVQLVAGQSTPIVWYSTSAGFFSGRYSITISGAGQLALPATIPLTSISSMYPSLLGNQANIISSTDSVMLKNNEPNVDLEKHLGQLGSVNSSIEKNVAELKHKNEIAHRKLFDMINSLYKLINSQNSGRRGAISFENDMPNFDAE